MSTKTKPSVILLLAIMLSLLVSGGMAAPTLAQQNAWASFTLPDGYNPRGIKFFDENIGLTSGMRYDGEWIPFIFETADGGASWTEVSNTFASLESWSKTSSVTASGTTLSQSCTFSSVENFFMITAESIYAEANVHCTARMTGGLFSETDSSKVFRTADNGQTWEPVSLTGEIEGAVIEVIPVPDGGVWIEIYDNDTAMKQFLFSTDGTSFEPRSFANQPSKQVSDLTFPRPDFGYVELAFPFAEDNMSSHSVYVTKDGGESWTALPPLPDLQYSYIADSFFLDEQTGWAVGYALGDLGSQGVFLRTLDGGNTWEEALFPPAEEMLPDFNLTIGRVEFQNAYIGFAVGALTGISKIEWVLYVSADGGAVWEEVYRGQALGCLETTDTYIYICEENSILRMELPSPRPTPTPTTLPTLAPTRTLVPPTGTPAPSPTPTPDSSLPCFTAPAIFLLIGFLFWLWRKRP